MSSSLPFLGIDSYMYRRRSGNNSDTVPALTSDQWTLYPLDMQRRVLSEMRSKLEELKRILPLKKLAGYGGCAYQDIYDIISDMVAGNVQALETGGDLLEHRMEYIKEDYDAQII